MSPRQQACVAALCDSNREQWSAGTRPARNEESLIILKGQGETLIDGQPSKPFIAPAFVYIPPAARHNVSNTGKKLLEYVYVVAPAKQQ